jgi:YVTN family beta-propeller protein
MNVRISSTSGNRNRIISGFLRLFIFSLLAAMPLTTLHAQTVGYTLGGGNSITVTNIPANTTAATISAGSVQLPSIIVNSPDGTRVYALYEGAVGFPSTVVVIDTSSNTVVATISPVGEAPLGLAITPDGKTLYVADQIHAVLIVDTASNTVTGTIPVTGFPASLAITPDGTRLFVGLEGGNSVAIIDTATNTVEATSIPITCGFPIRMAVTPDNTQLYVVCLSPGKAIAISTATNTVTANIPFDGADLRLAITPDSSTVYVSGLTGNVVGAISTATNTVVATIPVGPQPTGVAVTPDGADVYVVMRGNSTADEIDTSTNTVVASGIPVAGGPQDLTIFNLTAPFAAFTIDNLVINNNLHEQGEFTLGPNTGGIDLAHQPVTLTVNDFQLTIPAGSFRQVGGNMHFVFNGTVNGMSVNFNLKGVNGSSSQFTYVVDVHGVSIGGPNPATVGLKIGHNSGTTTAPF